MPFYVHVPAEVRSKLDPKAEKRVFVGYLEEQNGYRCYNPLIKRIVVSHDVIFDELGSWYSPKENVETDEDKDKSENGRDGHGNGNNVGQQSSTSIECIEPSEKCSSKSDSTAWSGKNTGHKKYEDKKGKQKIPEYEMCDDGSRNMEDVDSDVSLDDELGICLEDPWY